MIPILQAYLLNAPMTNPENEERMTEMTAIETTGNQLTLEQWLEIRKEAGLRIDPETAEVTWSFELTLDPADVSPLLQRRLRPLDS